MPATGGEGGLLTELLRAVESTDRLAEAQERAAVILRRAVAVLRPDAVPGFVGGLARQLVAARQGVTRPNHGFPAPGPNDHPGPGKRAWLVEWPVMTWELGADGRFVEVPREYRTSRMFAHGWSVVAGGVLMFVATSPIVRRHFLGRETPATREETLFDRAQAACVLGSRPISGLPRRGSM